jgi:ABC-type dipeptide/oligopeptide/nickel transport system permease component
MDVSLAGFQSATDLAKQLISLATGSLALSITFAKDIVKTNVPVVTWPLKIAWIAWLLSICFGIWTMMAVTGMLFKIAENADASKTVTYAANVSIPAFLQILMFLLGIALLILHGAKMLRVKTDSTRRS